jgi:hypothetical protein
VRVSSHCLLPDAPPAAHLTDDLSRGVELSHSLLCIVIHEQGNMDRDAYGLQALAGYCLFARGVMP